MLQLEVLEVYDAALGLYSIGRISGFRLSRTVRMFELVQASNVMLCNFQFDLMSQA